MLIHFLFDMQLLIQIIFLAAFLFTAISVEFSGCNTALVITLDTT